MKKSERQKRHIEGPQHPHEKPRPPQTKKTPKKQQRAVLEAEYRRGIIDGFLAGFDAAQKLETGRTSRVEVLSDILERLGHRPTRLSWR